MTEPRDRWIDSEIRRLDQRVDNVERATNTALTALDRTADKAGATRTLLVAFAAVAIAFLSLGLAILAFATR